MTKTINTSRISFILAGVLFALVFVSSAAIPTTHAAISTELDLGENGSEVTELQQFLATNSLIYPSGIVSGFFGPLTEAAVRQFQASYDIPQAGRVGPITRARINNIMSSGFGLDTRAPMMENRSVQTNSTNATINWTTNELARGQVYFDRLPIRSDEATGRAGQAIAYVSGVSAPNNTSALSSQSVTIQNLQPNTLYYYFTRAIDNSGNVKVTLSNTFQTKQ
jgi:peptidoglycan hydrolase-like protein with peptidoglycan-binding domain